MRSKDGLPATPEDACWTTGMGLSVQPGVHGVFSLFLVVGGQIMKRLRWIDQGV